MLTRNPVKIPILPVPTLSGGFRPCRKGSLLRSQEEAGLAGGLEVQGQSSHRELWSGRWESKQRPKLGKLPYCHCTTPALIQLILPAIPACEQPLILRKEDSIPTVTSAPPAVPLAPSNSIFMASRIFARSMSRNATRAPHKTHRG